MAARKAIGIIRVSQRAGREGESFASPTDQADRIEAACDRENLTLVPFGDGIREFKPGIADEVDVSGGAPLEDRPGLLAAVEAIEAGRAQVLVVGYFDRLVRSLKVQGEVVSRVEAAGGSVLAVDVGEVSEATAAKWLSGSVLGLLGEYVRRSSGERSAEAQAAAVARGVPPFRPPPGYDRGDDGRFVPNDDAEAVREAFRMRSEGASVPTVRRFLADKGIERSESTVGRMLTSVTYIGAIEFGDLRNPKAHRAIIDKDIFDAVGRMVISRGRTAKSNRLLARLGVLRCASCNSKMVVQRSDSPRASYRCPNIDCAHRSYIKCSTVEDFTMRELKRHLADATGRASRDEEARRATCEAAEAQKRLDAYLRLVDVLEGEAAAQERLAELAADRDTKREVAGRLARNAGTPYIIDVEALDRFTRTNLRKVIQAEIARVTVRPGRGGDRLRIEFH